MQKTREHEEGLKRKGITTHSEVFKKDFNSRAKPGASRAQARTASRLRDATTHKGNMSELIIYS